MTRANDDEKDATAEPESSGEGEAPAAEADAGAAAGAGAADVESRGVPAGPGNKPPARAPASVAAAGRGGPGFFTIYKKGQGYWTRMGTAIAAAVIGAFTAYNLYVYVPTFLPAPSAPPGLDATHEAQSIARQQAVHGQIALAVSLGFLVVYCLIAWRLMNKAGNVDFLVATDSEMKKVNWTSRKELIGSTKVVILFMFLTALFLFLIDILFGYLMHLIHVLKQGPLG